MAAASAGASSVSETAQQSVGSPPTTEWTCSGAVPDVKTLDNLSKELSDCWIRLGIQLNVKAATIDCIHNDNVQYPSIQAKAFAMLRAWHDTGSAATFKQLAEGLRKIDKVVLAEKYCKPSNAAGVSLFININGHSGVHLDGTSLPTPSVGDIMKLIAAAYLTSSPPQSREERHEFREYLQDIRQLIIENEKVSSLRITVRCKSLEILEDLWQEYTIGALNEAAQRCLVADEVLKKYNLKQFKLVTTIDEGEYSRCKAQFIETQKLQRCGQTEFTTVPGKTVGFPQTESTTIPGKTAGFPPTESTTLPGKTAGFPQTESTTVPRKTAGFTQTESLSDRLLGLKLKTPEAEKDPDFKSQSIKKMITLKSLALDAVLKIDEKTGYSVLHTICINKDEYNANRVAIQAILAGHDIEQHRVSEKAKEFAGMTPSMILKMAGFTDQAFMGLNHMFGDATREVFTHLQEGNVDPLIRYSFERQNIFEWQRMDYHHNFVSLMALGSVKAVKSLVERRGEVRDGEILLFEEEEEEEEEAEVWSMRTRMSYVACSEHQLKIALCAASAWNNYSMAELVIREGADVNGYISGKTALHYAAGNGNVEIVKLLLASGAHINQTDRIGNSALHLSLAPRVSFQLGFCGDLNSTFAVSAFSSVKRAQTANFLIEQASVETEAKNQLGENPLYLSLAAGNAEAVLHLSGEKARGKEYPPTGDMRLRRLIELKLLDVNIINDKGKTPLHQSVKAGDVKTVAWLLQLGAKLDLQDNEGRTSLHLAAMKGYEELVDVLLKRSVEIDAVDKQGRTALHVALDLCHPKIAAKLAVGGAKLDLQDNEDRTSLHLAAMKGYEELVDVLLKRSVEIDAVDKQGRTALQMALDCSHLKTAVKLIEGGAKLDSKGHKVQSLLHEAIEKGDVTIIKPIVKMGADINETVKHGKTFLHVSVEKQNLDEMKALIDSGVDVNRQTDSGCTALRLALKANAPEERVAMIRILLEAGADVNIRDIVGKSPLDIADSYRYVECAELLRQSGKYQR